MTECFKCGKLLPGNLRPGEYVMYKECEEKFKEATSPQDIFGIGAISAMALGKPFGWVFTPKAKKLTIEVTNRAVVFCRDCEEYKEWDGSKICMRLGSYYGNMKLDDYCSYGVRKDGDI